MKEKFEASEEEKRLRSMMRQYEACLLYTSKERRGKRGIEEDMPVTAWLCGQR